MQHALVRQSTTILDFYLDEVHALGAELSISTLLVRRQRRPCRRWPTRSPDHSPHRSDEPYRRALIGIYARLAATARELGATNILRKEVGHADAVRATPPNSRADLQVLADSLRANHGALLVKPRLAGLHARRRASSASTWPRSTCARARTCTSACWPNCSPAPASKPTTPRSTKTRKSSCCWPNWRSRACCIRPTPTTRDETAVGTGDPARGARDPPALRRARDPQLHHLAHRNRVRPAGSAAAAEGNRPAAHRATASCDVMVIPLFETIPDLQRAAGIMEEWMALPLVTRR